MSGVRLRPVEIADLDALFAFESDPVAVQMAAFTPKDPSDRATFDAHWRRMLTDESMLVRTVTADGRVAGMIASFVLEGQRELTYWIDRAHWGKGIATSALAELLREDTTRPIFARTAKDNTGSRRVLEKCGFRLVEEGRWFSNARGAEIDELLLRLD